MNELLNNTEPVSFGEPRESELERETVVAVIYDVRSKLYLCQYWAEYAGLTCMLSGGVEPDEDQDEAIKREIAEETGFTDFAVLGTLGGLIESHYTKADGQNYVKVIRPYFVELKSTEREQTQKEDDEKFENYFKKPDEIVDMMTVYETSTGSSLADHKEVLRRGVEYVQNI
jgi:8-oxo-dGTP pyrophosphatase MutT (NUDIX family)